MQLIKPNKLAYCILFPSPCTKRKSHYIKLHYYFIKVALAAQPTANIHNSSVPRAYALFILHSIASEWLNPVERIKLIVSLLIWYLPKAKDFGPLSGRKIVNKKKRKKKKKIKKPILYNNTLWLVSFSCIC